MVISDYRMPAMNGVEFLRKIKEANSINQTLSNPSLTVMIRV
jgi:CheY-like chemotaxis protein